MLRHFNRTAVRTFAFLTVVVLCGCGVKGPLVPAPNAKTQAPPTTPQIPSATIPGNPEEKP